MSQNDHRYFSELKKKIVAKMQESYPGINPSISEWKGQEITDFQEELLKSVNAHLSEKWFYTHMKSAGKSLPRIDVLNLLSKYAGYANWDDFVFRNKDLIESSQNAAVQATEAVKKVPDKSNRYFYIIPVVTVVLVVIFFGIFKLFNTREYIFSFYDADTMEPIKDSKIEVRLLPDGESPVTGFCSADGNYILKTDKSRVRMVVKAPYYKTDTITRIVKKLNRNEIVSLHANDYALMIHYFSTMKVDDWGKRRSKLENMIDNSAVIYQVNTGRSAASGMEILNREEFIDRMTMPAGSLKNIEVVDTKYQNGKIMVLRFRVNVDER